MKKYLCFLIFLFSFNAFATATLTSLEPGVSIYSEYYPKAKARETFIFINGSGSDISVWKSKSLFNCAKSLGSVFLYDRNGVGKSPPDLQLSGKKPITAKLISDRLSALLNKLNIKPPYILVAHSHGALYASYFTLKNPNQVKSVLFVDPIPKNCDFSRNALDKLAKGLEDAKTKPAEYIYKNYNGAEAENFYQILGLNENKQSIQQLGDFDKAIPVIILSSKKMEEAQVCEKDWYEGQKLWLNKNPKSKIAQVSSDHFIQLTKPELVCAELRHILSMCI